MDAIAYIQREVNGLRWQANMILKETTDEQLNWTPPGIANPIGVTLLHIIGTEDQLVQQLLQGKPYLWESGNWSERVGVEVVPHEGRGWEECRKAHLSLAPIMAYQEAVCSATADFIASLSPEDLDRPIMLFGREQPIAIVLVIIVNHAILHMGEIAALKGIQGIQGLPF